MGLKEKVIAQSKRDLEIEHRNRIKNAKHYEERAKKRKIFWAICERLTNRIDLSDIECYTYAKVFELIEINHIDISDILHGYDYDEFKNELLQSNIQFCPNLGKEPERIYDFHNIDDVLEYEKKYGRIDGSI
jgi:hypothetical protein